MAVNMSYMVIMPVVLPVLLGIVLLLVPETKFANRKILINIK